MSETWDTSLDELIAQFPTPHQIPTSWGSPSPDSLTLPHYDTIPTLSRPRSIDSSLYDWSTGLSMSSDFSDVSPRSSLPSGIPVNESSPYATRTNTMNTYQSDVINSPNFFTSVLNRFKKEPTSLKKPTFDFKEMDALSEALDRSQRLSLVSQRYGTSSNLHKVPNLVASHRS